MTHQVWQQGAFRPCDKALTALGLQRARGVVSFLGSGGKSTLIRALAAEAAAAGARVVITTTTHIFPGPGFEPDPRRALETLDSQGVVTLGRPGPEGKLKSPGSHWIREAARLADLVLIEADGSAGQPLKMPADYEPVIDKATTHCVLLVGLSALGARLGTVCQRFPLAAAQGLASDSPVTAALLSHLLTAGYLERFAGCLRHLAFNQVDDPEKEAAATELARRLAERRLSFSTHHFPAEKRGSPEIMEGNRYV